MRHGISLLFLSFLILGSLVFSAETWTEYSKNPVFTPAQGRQAKNPCVVYDQSGFESADLAASYKMWFATEDGIALAYSNDGLVWTEYNYSQPLSSLQSTADLPYVIYDKDGFGGKNYYYRIWYWNGVSDSIEGIRTAESKDGIVWENDRPIQQHSSDPSLQLVTDSSAYDGYFYHCYGPGSVLYNPNGMDTGSATPFDKSDDQPMTYRYVMYYNSSSEGLSPEGGAVQTSLAYSTDGLYWIRYGNKPVISPVGNIKRQNAQRNFIARVIHIDGVYMMFYSSFKSPIGASPIETAVSADGMDWKINRKAGLKLKDSIKPANDSILGYSIIRKSDNSKYGMWTSVKDDTGKYSINYYEIKMKELPGGESKGINISSSKGYTPFSFIVWINKQDWDHEMTCSTDEMYWRWDFGDGTGYSGYDAWELDHAYEKAGIYTITATNLCQGIYDLYSDTQIVEVLVSPTPIIPCFTTEPTTGFAPLEITFEADCSQLPESLLVASYGWSFGDGQFASGYTAKHTYVNPGVYYTLLSIEDSWGNLYYFSAKNTVKGLYPPINIKLEKRVNRSLFKGTVDNILKWSSSPRIFECTVTKFNIYRKLSSQPDSDYQQIGSVDCNTYTFTDKNINIKRVYSYIMTAVESDGHESVFSIPVE